jgi:hypothetical protein
MHPFSTSATNWPIVSASGDYEDGEISGMMIGRGNRSTRKKPAPVPLCPPQISHDLTLFEPGPYLRVSQTRNQHETGGKKKD